MVADSKANTYNQIVRKLSALEKGRIFFPIDFIDDGSSEAVRQSLVRLEKESYLKRLARGIYFVPKVDPLLGILYPSSEEIAKAIAQRDKARIMPAGIYALNRLGLSTQVPLKITYLTDGSPRKIQTGKLTITFKTTSAKNLSLRGEISSLVIQALRELGPQGVTREILSRIGTLLAKESPEILEHDRRLAPGWIRKLLFRPADSHANANKD